MKLTYGQFAALAGVTERTAKAWVGEGSIPRHPDGGPDAAAVLRAGIAALKSEARPEASSLEQAKARVARLTGDRLEIVTAQMRADLIPATEVGQVIGAAFDAVRSKMLAMPSALAARVAVATEAADVRAMLTEAVSDALSDLADGEVLGAVKARSRALASRVEDDGEASQEAEAAA